MGEEKVVLHYWVCLLMQEGICAQPSTLDLLLHMNMEAMPKKLVTFQTPGLLNPDMHTFL